jgi:hypothetical protein
MRANTKESLSKKVRRLKSGCCNFTGAISKYGYGVVGFNGKVIGAHRAMYLATFGEFDRSLCVCHRCDNRKCINPNHLFLGTHMDNIHDMISKGRRKYRNGQTNAMALTHCYRGHEFTPETTTLNKKGHRSCKICQSITSKERYKKTKIKRKAL